MKYPIRRIDTYNYMIDEYETVHCTDNIIGDSLKEMLHPSFEGSETSESDIEYFVTKCSAITEVFYVKGGSPGRLKSELHAPVRIKLLDEDAVWRCKSVPLGSKR